LQQHQQGQLIQADFFENMGGLNLTDSPFRISDSQATTGFNFDYLETGAFKKRNAHTLLGSADAQLKTFGVGLLITPANLRTLIRWAGTKIQTVDSTTYACTNVTDDTVGASSTFLDSTSLVPAKLVQFTTATNQVMWGVGAGATSIYGYTGSKVTANGVPAPTSASSITTGSASTTGGFLAGGTTYWYAIAYRKASTLATSNAALDVSYAVPAGTNTNQITLTLPTLSNADTTKYDKILIYRSASGGVTGFTTGDLIATINSSVTTFADTIASSGAATNIPRAGNTVKDNSVLPSGTPTGLVVFKRRLVTALGSTVYLSDVNLPESWPASNTITIPSGGPITAFGIISFSTPTSSSDDEFLVVFKEREAWLIIGNSVSDWSLKFSDATGCLSQTSVVSANGFLFWLDYRGVYAWDGSSKPSYLSRPVEFAFSPDGDIDRSKLGLCVGEFSRKQNQVIWALSSSTLGEQKYQLKLDLRLTLPQMNSTMMGRITEGVFCQDKTDFPVYAMSSLLPTFDEKLFCGDASGNLYKMYDNGLSDAGASWNFSYRTKPLDMGSLSTTKRYHKVIVWVRETSTNNLTLNYWVGYRNDSANQATQANPITRNVTNALWDQATFDSAYWDTILKTYSPVVFNLQNTRAGTDGDALTLEFVQNDLNTPVTIAGFSVIYSHLGVRK
jgi:hypothetical protein